VERWPPQVRSVTETLQAIADGVPNEPLCLTLPTGGGKTLIATDLITEWLECGLKSMFYTNRIMLTGQTLRSLDKQGISYGVRAAGHVTELEQAVQVASMQTEHSRVNRRQVWQPFDADRVIIDECHLQKGDVAQGIMKRHVAHGAYIVGLTATPIELGDLYGKLIVGGTKAELRECGALVPAWHYGPDEPDMRALRKVQAGLNYSENQQRSAIMRKGVFGRVLQWYNELNPTQRPTLMFCPGVAESVWFAQQFDNAGIPAAHIDGESCWIDGKIVPTKQDVRDDIAERSRRGKIKVVLNRYVLREGIDWPWIEHLILGVVLGSLQSYLQIVGRGLRACKDTDKERLIIQDHGGHWWRHGSANADFDWKLTYTNTMLAAMREDALRDKRERQPAKCPKCKMILSTRICATCGYDVKSIPLVREVVQVDGTMKEMRGDIFRPHRTYARQDGPARWERMYWRSRTERGAKTFRQAAALFAAENKWGWPDRRWPFMPVNFRDWYKMVSDVPMESLIPKGA
jgi:superfamily II DNA or RNA helicase